MSVIKDQELLDRFRDEWHRNAQTFERERFTITKNLLLALLLGVLLLAGYYLLGNLLGPF